MKRFAATLAKLCLATLATFLLVEAALLVFNDVFFQRSFYTFDRDIGFRVRSHVLYGDHTTNEFGFNDRDYEHERRPGTFRVLVIGDSFNWTFGPDGNYAGVLERLLGARFAGCGVEVVNAGYPQMHTGQQLALLRKFGMQYRPDLVVLGFFVGNDFYDADPDRLRVVVGGVTADVRPDREFYRVVFGQPLVLRSRLLLFARERWNELSRVGEAERKQLAAPPAIEQVLGLDAPPRERARARATTSGAYFQWLGRRMDFARKSEAARFVRNEAYVRDSLREMRDLLAAEGVPFVVAAYPDAVQVEPEIQNGLLARTGRAADDYEWTRAQRLLATDAAELGVPFHDLLPGFVAARERGWNLYLVDDSHWSAAGNVLAAELLLPAIAPFVESACAPEAGSPADG